MTVSAHQRFANQHRSWSLSDLAIAVVLLAGSLALLAHGGITPSHPGRDKLDLVGFLLAACSTVPLFAWRRFPLGVFAVSGAAGIALASLGYPLDLMLGPTVALYLLAASRDREAPWTMTTTSVVIGMLVGYLAATAAALSTFPGIELLHTGLAWAVAWFAGERTRLQREQIAELKERALRSDQEIDRERLLAVAEERARIARDLHDSAGHAINVIAVRAGAARLRHFEDPDRSLRALEAIEEVARQTAEEIDVMVGTLREDGSTNGVIEAPIGLASLDSLIASQVEAGLDVTIDTSGIPPALGHAVDQAAYRILQEALTNAARHGTGSVRIEFAFDDTAVDLTVTNSMSAVTSTATGTGHGLIGMRERATLLGGSLDAARSNGGFRVHARIPFRGHPA